MSGAELCGEVGFLMARGEPEVWEAYWDCGGRDGYWAVYEDWKNWQYCLLIDDNTKWRRNGQRLLDSLGISIERDGEGRPISWSIRLNEYQRSNLLWLLCDVVGYGRKTCMVSGLHTGDWVGEIANMLRLNEKGEMEESWHVANGNMNPRVLRVVDPSESIYQGVG